MKYNVGDRVRVQSLDWYNENKNKSGNVPMGQFSFNFCNKHLCGTILTIRRVLGDYYLVKENDAYWTDEMIEGLVEEENNPKFKKGDCVKCSDGSIGIIVTCDWSDSLNCYQYYVDYIGTLDAGYQPEKDLQPHTITTMNGKDIFEGAKWKHEFECPDGYIFKDENGNVINATKIVLEKKKKEYPKTYEECCKVLGGVTSACWSGYKCGVLGALNKLLICRDAYWVIAGEEMGLDGIWEPDWKNSEMKYTISFEEGEYTPYRTFSVNCPFAFPTEEMRDAFYENFKELIESCKELL